MHPTPDVRSRRPRRFQYDLVVIGAGAAGLSAAYLGAALKARVALVEGGTMGGDCLNGGCVPSKALIRTTRLLADIRRGDELGLPSATASVDFPRVMERVQSVIARVAPHDSVERYTALGVDCLQGRARVVSPWAVAVAGRELTTRRIIVATGAAPRLPEVPGLANAPYVTSETVWGLTELPARLLVLGGGPVACELGQCFARLGSRVSLAYRGPRLLGKEDPDAAEAVAAGLAADGVRLYPGHRPTEFRAGAGGPELVCTGPDGTATLPFDRVLLALGRVPRTAGLGLEDLGIVPGQDRALPVDRHLRTAVPSVFGVGDALGRWMYTHAASHEAWHAVVNALFGSPLWRARVDYQSLPRVTFTEPEVAAVGHNETSAAAAGVPFQVTRYDMADLDRAITDGRAQGQVKVLTVPGRDRILGASVIGPGAGEILAELTLAQGRGLGLGAILSTPHAYPTLGEANRYAAGAWRRQRTSPRLLTLLERYHRWRRGGA